MWLVYHTQGSLCVRHFGHVCPNSHSQGRCALPRGFLDPLDRPEMPEINAPGTAFNQQLTGTDEYPMNIPTRVSFLHQNQLSNPGPITEATENILPAKPEQVCIKDSPNPTAKGPRAVNPYRCTQRTQEWPDHLKAVR